MTEQTTDTELRAALLEHRSKFVLTLLEASSKMIGDLVRTMFLFNGGALVALLALMGALARNNVKLPSDMTDVVIWFGSGLGCSMLATFFAWGFMDILANVENAALQNGEPSPSLAPSTSKIFAPGVCAALLVMALTASGTFGIIGMLVSAQILGNIGT